MDSPLLEPLGQFTPEGQLSISDLDQYKVFNVPRSYPANQRTFYPPYEDVQPVIMAVLNDCTSSLVLGMYGLTDPKLAARLHELLEMPHVFCQLNIDKTQMAGRTQSQVLAFFKNYLASNTVAVGRSPKGAINHNKVLVVDGIWTITGSTNWSVNGEQRQNNQLTVTYDATVAAEARHVLDLEHAAMLTQRTRNTKKETP